MGWGVNYDCLNSLIPLQGNVITATYVDEPVEDSSDSTYAVCEAIGVARRGKVINLSQA